MPFTERKVRKRTCVQEPSMSMETVREQKLEGSRRPCEGLGISVAANIPYCCLPSSLSCCGSPFPHMETPVEHSYLEQSLGGYGVQR